MKAFQIQINEDLVRCGLSAISVKHGNVIQSLSLSHACEKLQIAPGLVKVIFNYTDYCGRAVMYHGEYLYPDGCWGRILLTRRPQLGKHHQRN